MTYADIGAERPIAAQKGNEKIVVEIKSFVGRSPIYDLEQAIGQYSLYKALLSETEPERQVYLAITETIYATMFSTYAGQVIIRELGISTCIVDLENEEILRWIR